MNKIYDTKSRCCSTLYLTLDDYPIILPNKASILSNFDLTDCICHHGVCLLCGSERTSEIHMKN